MPWQPDRRRAVLCARVQGDEIIDNRTTSPKRKTDAYLTKPLDVDEFLSTIDRLLPEPVAA
jgi:hypothetical protein